MRYERFVGARRALWDEFEERLSRAGRLERLGYAEVEALALRYRQVLHDHALAAARFPGTEAARRLHRLALEGTHDLQRDRADRLPGPGEFLTHRFPLAMRRHLPLFAVAVALFAATALFGFVAAFVQPALGSAFLGERAVEELQQGRLWTDSLATAVPPALTSSAIATNNIGVAIVGWAGGSLAGIGGFYVVLMNGFLLGTVLGTTAHYGMGHRLLEFVAAHGPLEITLILVSSGAGLGLGRALLVADDRPRRQALREGARESLTVLLGCLPWFAVLALVEALVSPSPALPATVKVAAGLALESVFLLAVFAPLRKESRR